ncbi:MAG: RNA methyltransferase [Bryobacteraceae bacterium]|nr:RNA methyltransferase [Bryobacteraceae bacterium]
MPASKIQRALPIGLRHPLLKSIRKGIQKGGLTDEGWAVAESFHLLEEGLRAELEISAIVVSESVRYTVEGRVSGLGHVPIYYLPERDFADLASTENSQGVISLLRPPAWTMEQLFRGTALVVVLDGLQDPGNAGAIVRSAEAFGATGVLALKGTVNLHNPKCLRAAAGSLFRLPCVQGVEDEMARAALAQRKVEAYATVPQGGRSIYSVNLTTSSALIIGSEGRGVSQRLRDAAFDLHIPTAGVESLNAAIAASIFLYEARRQRSSNA